MSLQSGRDRLPFLEAPRRVVQHLVGPISPGILTVEIQERLTAVHERGVVVAALRLGRELLRSGPIGPHRMTNRKQCQESQSAHARSTPCGIDRFQAFETRPTTTVMLSSPPRSFASAIRVSGSL